MTINKLQEANADISFDKLLWTATVQLFGGTVLGYPGLKTWKTIHALANLTDRDISSGKTLNRAMLFDQG